MPNKHEIMTALRQTGVIVVVRTESADDLLSVAKALHDGGVKFIEITMTVPDALGVIREAVRVLKDRDVYIGAGTVLDAETARMAILAGSSFIVGPAFDKGMVDLCRTYGVLVMAGGLTPNEIVNAWKGGADVVKVFPVKSVGGAEYLKAVKQPLPQVELVPTNGVDFETAASFIKAGAIAVGVGNAIVSKALISGKEFGTITANARRMIEVVRMARGRNSA